MGVCDDCGAENADADRRGSGPTWTVVGERGAVGEHIHESAFETVKAGENGHGIEAAIQA
jgi:hypothetical protein